MRLFLLCILSMVLCQYLQSQITSSNFTSAKNLLDQKKPNEALNEIQSILKSSNQLSTPDSITAFSLTGQCYFNLKQYEPAVKNYQSALSVLNLNDTLQALFHDQLGRGLYRLSQYTSATEHISKARDLYRKLYGTDDKNYTGALNTLGFLYNIQANYSEAEKIFLEAKQINLRMTGGEDLQYSRIINNLADVYSKLNRFEQADELYKTSLRIKEKLSGKNSRDYANTLYNLANFQASLGRYDKAKTTIQEGIDIFNTIKETNHPDYLKFLDNLAILTGKTGNPKEAENLFKDALHRREAAGLIKQDDYALNLRNLGELLININKTDSALIYIEKAVPLSATIYGKKHPTYAGLLISLANIQSKKADNEKAEQNYKEAIQIIQKSLGKDHIENFNSQFAYAKFLRKTGKKTEAIALIKKIELIPHAYLKRAARFLSEMELNDKIEEYKSYIHEVYSFLRELPAEKDLSELAMNTSLYYRGYILNHLQRIRAGMSKARKVSDTRDELISLHRQLENELNRPLTERSNTTELEKHISEKESELSNTLGSFSDDTKDLNWEDIQLALNDDEAVAEYISFPDSHANDSVQYAVLILTKSSAGPMIIDLCKESEFSSLLSSHVSRTADYVSSVYNFSNRGASLVGEKKIKLSDLIWSPINHALQNTKRIYLVPDGLLNRINIAALPTSLETVVADSLEIILLNSSRQIVPGDEHIMAYNGKRAMVIGGIDYDNDAGEMVASRATTTQQQGKRLWSSLPWAEKESSAISGILKTGGFDVVAMNNNSAREKIIVDSMESHNGWRVLHFATHGYFNLKTEQNQTSANQYYGNGMMNSGLVLAGANTQYNNPSANQNDDGLLSAYEISHLDLSQTELVVLSACETALGDIKETEGVYGLQRAFKLAGASHLIMSLWQVPDRETKDFMQKFYTNWMNDKSSIRQAFQKTQKEFRQRFDNPYQWAGFVLLE